MKNDNYYKNKCNIEKQDAYIQVDLLNEIVQEEKKKLKKEYKIKENELKEKINDLTENIELLKDKNKQDIIDLKNEINSKKEEIIRLTNLNSKLKRNLEKMSQKVNNLYNKILEKNRLNNINYKLNINMIKPNNLSNRNNSNNNNNNDNSDIIINKDNDDINEIIKIKDKQIKDSLSMISYLTREKNKLKEELFNIKDQTKNLNKSAIINGGENKTNLFKTSNIQNYNKNRPNQNDKDNTNLELNDENQKDNEQNNQYNDNNNNNINNNMNNSIIKNDYDLLQKKMNYSSTIYKNFLLKKNNNMKRATSSTNFLNSKKLIQENVNAKISKLFNESERKALSTLFNSEKEFEYFNQKINILHNHNTAIERKLLLKIKTLTIDNEEKKEQIQYLQDKLRECESKLKTLDHKLNYEKFLLRQTRKTLNKNQNSVPSSTRKDFNINKDFKNSSFVINKSIEN